MSNPHAGSAPGFANGVTGNDGKDLPLIIGGHADKERPAIWREPDNRSSIARNARVDRYGGLPMASVANPSFLRAMTQDPARRWTLRRASDGQLVAGTLIPAFNRDTRNKRLLGRHALEPGSAMILAPSRQRAHVLHAVPDRHRLVACDGER
jgi:hypothetical protein